MIDPADLAACREAIRHGSVSFHAASRLLPARVRDPALALYAFCRVADDEVDLTRDKVRALADLEERLARVYEGRPCDAAADRAFAAVVEAFEMPRALPEALLEGLAWDAADRRYDTISDLFAYSARVASAVGVMMCVLMRARDPDTLARAADLGVAMQLTNIARDVGEDALERRLYLPVEWLASAGIDPQDFFDDPRPTKAIRQMVRRLLIEADRLYRRSDSGVAALPLGCRPGIFAARHIYAGIGERIRLMEHDSISSRAHTSRAQKLALLGFSVGQTATSLVMPQSAKIFAAPLPETAFLVDAAAHRPDRPHWSQPLTRALAHSAAADRQRRAEMLDAAARAKTV